MKRKDRAIKKITNDLERLRISGQDDMVTDKAEALAKYTHKMAKDILASQPDEQKLPQKRCHIIINIFKNLGCEFFNHNRIMDSCNKSTQRKREVFKRFVL